MAQHSEGVARSLVEGVAALVEGVARSLVEHGENGARPKQQSSLSGSRALQNPEGIPLLLSGCVLVGLRQLN